MNTLEFANPKVGEMYAAFGLASYRAQQFETILISTAMYSLATAQQFKNVTEIEKTNAKLSTIPMGQVFLRLKPLLSDELLTAQIETALTSRNTLVHHYFRNHQAGPEMTSVELQASIAWCRKESKRFKSVTEKLTTRRDEQRAIFARNPNTFVSEITTYLAAVQALEGP